MKPKYIEIEQAIARGLTPSQIIHTLDVDYATYRAVADAMELANRIEALGRKYESYFGPAHPDTIAGLVDAVTPRQRPAKARDKRGRYAPRRKKEAA